MKTEIPKLGKIHYTTGNLESYRVEMSDKVKAMQEDIFKDTTDRLTAFNEELESEFHKVIRTLGLPMDKEAIKAAGIVVERGSTELIMEDQAYPFSSVDHTATITQHGKAISRTIKMNDSRVSTGCLAPTLKQALIIDGMLCEVLDDLKRMTEDSSKTLQEFLDEP